MNARVHAQHGLFNGWWIEGAGMRKMTTIRDERDLFIKNSFSYSAHRGAASLTGVVTLEPPPQASVLATTACRGKSSSAVQRAIVRHVYRTMTEAA